MDCAGYALEVKDLSLAIDGKDILREINLQVTEKTLTLIFGKSGSGKSSLLNVLNMLYVPDGGDYVICGEKCSTKIKRADGLC